MIRSSLFSLDGSSVWDPKTSGQILRISDDQLQVLNNLPEWSKVTTKDSLNLGITKESIILSSQSSEVRSQISEIINTENHQNIKNIELFEKNQQYRKQLLKTLESNTRKRNKSSSLIEIGKHNNKDFLSLTALKRTSSTPDIHLQNFHPKSISTKKQSLNITYSVSSASQNRSKDIFSNTVEVNSFKLLDQNRSIPECKSNKTESYNLKRSFEDMEVITQQPVNVNALNDRERFELTQEKQDKVSPHVEPEKLSNSQDDKPVDNVIGNEEKNSNKDEARTKLMEEVLTVLAKEKLSNLGNEEQVSNGHENHEEKSGQVISINSGQRVDLNDLTSDEIESASCIKQPVYESDVSNGNKVRIINLDLEKVERSENSEDIPRLSEKISSDVANIQDSSKSPQAIDVFNASSDKLAAAETPVTFKRKAEAKKSSKKRKYQNKKGEPDVRSLKKAGDITYSFEDIEILLDLIKQFL